ncbi:DnaT-like ssDNA-binding domain-containing protein [Kistimonas asteriae]|uniref:DnaT-like ssDNA-binding domain-containing protein n=1 Tax=Kistimonas asteriae TaxID=517724 RepID=UPI001BA7DE54|nr:DnaT-like ssDNA-binding domain-containing protein [Kistimonas asteriae]
MSKGYKAPGRRAYEQDKPLFQIMDEGGDDSPTHPVFAENREVREGARVQPLPEDFEPDSRYIQFLQLHHGIPPEFTLAQLPDFKLYWLETGEGRKAWQNRFKNHVIYQWRRQQSEGGRESHRSTAEKLTDTSWSDAYRIDLDED